MCVLAAPACSSDADSDGEPAAASGSTADLAITEVVFNDHLTITNLGSAVGAGLWPAGDTAEAGSASFSAPSGGSSGDDWS